MAKARRLRTGSIQGRASETVVADRKCIRAAASMQKTEQSMETTMTCTMRTIEIGDIPFLLLMLEMNFPELYAVMN
jgi:hypothetical protein